MKGASYALSRFKKTKRLDVYGKPSDAVLGMIRQLAASGVPLSVNDQNGDHLMSAIVEKRGVGHG